MRSFATGRYVHFCRCFIIYHLKIKTVMFNVIGIMLTGICIGYIFRKFEFLQKTEKSISCTIVALLFVLGLSIGSNHLIIDNLWRFGWQAAVLATAGLLGSMFAARIVYVLLFKKEEQKGGEEQ